MEKPPEIPTKYTDKTRKPSTDLKPQKRIRREIGLPEWENKPDIATLNESIKNLADQIKELDIGIKRKEIEKHESHGIQDFYKQHDKEQKLLKYEKEILVKAGNNINMFVQMLESPNSIIRSRAEEKWNKWKKNLEGDDESLRSIATSIAKAINGITQQSSDTSSSPLSTENLFDSKYPPEENLPLHEQDILLSRGEDPTAQFSLPTHKEAALYWDSQNSQQQENIVDNLLTNQQTKVTDKKGKDKDISPIQEYSEQEMKSKQLERLLDIYRKDEYYINRIRDSVTYYKGTLLRIISNKKLDIENTDNNTVKEAINTEKIQKTFNKLCPQDYSIPKNIFKGKSDPDNHLGQALDNILKTEITYYNWSTGKDLEKNLKALNLKIEQYDDNIISPEQHNEKYDFGGIEEISQITRADITESFAQYISLRSIANLLKSNIKDSKVTIPQHNTLIKLWSDIANDKHQSTKLLTIDDKKLLKERMDTTIQIVRARNAVHNMSFVMEPLQSQSNPYHRPNLD